MIDRKVKLLHMERALTGTVLFFDDPKEHITHLSVEMTDESAKEYEIGDTYRVEIVKVDE